MYRLSIFLILGSCATFSSGSLNWVRSDGASVMPEKVEEDRIACSKESFSPETNPNAAGPRYTSMARTDDDKNDLMRGCMAQRGYKLVRTRS